MTTISVEQTLSISNHRVFAADLNEHETVFGGKILAIVDDNASIPASRVARVETVTAAIDRVDFIQPFRLQDSLCAESYVTGIGHRSIEVFTKIIGEHLQTGQRFLGLTCFATFVVTERDLVLPQLVVAGDNQEYQVLCQGYVQRQAARRVHLQAQAAFRQQISLDLPWQR